MKNNQEYNKNSVKHYIDGTFTKKEGQEALDDLRNKEYDPAINEHMMEIWNHSLQSTDSNAVEYGQNLNQAEKLLNRINRVPIYKKYIRAGLVAASIALLISIGIIGYKYLNVSEIPVLHYTEVSTGHGETKEVVLPDGSITVLNACSHLSYPAKFEGNERAITLDGEAYFNIAKNEAQPFIIVTENFNVRVLGTIFNVKAYKTDEIQSVNVESGKVQIDMPEAMARLLGKEQLNINTQKNSHIKEQSEYNDIATWRTGTLRFSSTPIEDVAKQLERVYSCRITFEHGQQFENTISGEHDNESLEEVLESIRLTSGIKWKANKTISEIVLYK